MPHFFHRLVPFPCLYTAIFECLRVRLVPHAMYNRSSDPKRKDRLQEVYLKTDRSLLYVVRRPSVGKRTMLQALILYLFN